LKCGAFIVAGANKDQHFDNICPMKRMKCLMFKCDFEHEPAQIVEHMITTHYESIKQRKLSTSEIFSFPHKLQIDHTLKRKIVKSMKLEGD
jgi:hypothetical protein